ncbi:aminotransferase class V-fold PLP-dependent enzyme [Actinoplanes rectilineatus]|uniref:aminotransferase class V-fold PLP-dependent enzyme n=1 Tax=Actinoplanes rectilineatus TaxID=113571 RepID=UPI0005F282E1|nr:aminotransferase class V-fold PLP-dependent enzyme [Actinoplanes rectilineatus]
MLLLPDGRPARAAWPLSDDLLHLNHGSFGAAPARVLAAQDALRAEMNAAPVRWFAGLPSRVASARTPIAGFLGVPAGTLALVPNASAGASAVFQSLNLPTGGEILVTDHGYGAVVMGAERRGPLRRARVPLAAGPEEAAAAVIDRFTARTALVVIDHVTSPTARFLPVAAISAAARERGIPVLVDGAHVPALIDRPLDGLDCDYWVGNLHKFACAPPGAAVLVTKDGRDLFPTIDSWGSPEPFPSRFDTQGTLDATAQLVAPRALAEIEGLWGWDQVRKYTEKVASDAAALVASAFTAITGEDHAVDVGMPTGPMRLIRLPGSLGAAPGAPDALRARVLDELNAECAFSTFGGQGYLRLSAHAYNTPADYESFAERCVPALTAWSRDLS